MRDRGVVDEEHVAGHHSEGHHVARVRERRVEGEGGDVLAGRSPARG
jgi:hypothetical protein